MQHDDALAGHKAIERTANARPATRPQLEKATAKGTRVRKPKTRTVLDEQLDQASVVRKDIDGPGLNFCENALMEVLDFKSP